MKTKNVLNSYWTWCCRGHIRWQQVTRRALSSQQEEASQEGTYTSIILNLDDNVFRQVNKERSSLEVWKKVDEVFLVKSLLSCISVKVMLFGFKMDLNKNLEVNLDD